MMNDLFDRTREEMTEKVRKLLAKAEDSAVTPEEAHVFTVKAQELMTKYSIGLAMVADVTRPGEVVEHAWVLEPPYATHKVSLVGAVARANDCRTLYSGMSNARRQIFVVGYAADVEWVEILYRSLELQMTVALAAATRDRSPAVHGRTFAVGFIAGFIDEVRRRLHAARKAAVATAQQERSDGPSVALVLVGKTQRVEDEFKVRHPDTRSVYRSTRLQSWSGYGPGRSAGGKASLARGAVGATRRSLSA